MWVGYGKTSSNNGGSTVKRITNNLIREKIDMTSSETLDTIHKSNCMRANIETKQEDANNISLVVTK